VYDEWYSGSAELAIPTLAELAGGGRTLELGIGTGRLAIPLRALGVEVHGVDVSPSMVAKMRDKPGGEDIPVMLGDFSQVPVEGKFDLVYVVFNTFFALTTQQAQVNCFTNVAQHLNSQGVFVIEAFVPDLTRFQGLQTVRAVELDLDSVRLDASTFDPVSQVVVSQHIYLSASGTHLYPVVIRFAWPAELDLMARLAGMQLRQRWSGWDRQPFTSASTRHISVYGIA
jgi:SAM-dependent methyltransferase